ncbi:MAG: DUF3991 domain-containing protein, partial [Rhodomicrobium sp.]
MIDEELGQFKTQINLSEFAAARGYALDRRESSRNSAVMRHPNGDKIIIAKNEASGDWIYFSVRDDRDNGTVIDFLQNRGGGTLGDVRKTLRAWSGGSRPEGRQLPLFARELLPTSKDRASVIAAWEGAQRCLSLPYLMARGLGPDVLALPRFIWRVRVDKRNNALFPHYDKDGLCGYEIKNKGFTGFASGGIKGLWYSKAEATDRQLLLTESAIDAISWQALFPDEKQTRHMSTGGELGPEQRGTFEALPSGELTLKQPGLLRLAMEKLPLGAVVLLGFDNDPPGEKLAEEVRALAPAGRELR